MSEPDIQTLPDAVTYGFGVFKDTSYDTDGVAHAVVVIAQRFVVDDTNVVGEQLFVFPADLAEQLRQQLKNPQPLPKQEGTN